MESDDFETIESGPNDPTYQPYESPIITQQADDQIRMMGRKRPGAGNRPDLADLGLVGPPESQVDDEDAPDVDEVREPLGFSWHGYGSC